MVAIGLIDGVGEGDGEGLGEGEGVGVGEGLDDETDEVGNVILGSFITFAT